MSDDKFKINFNEDVPDTPYAKQKQKLENISNLYKTIETFKLNSVSKTLMILGSSFCIYRYIKTKNINFLKSIVIFNSMTFLFGVMINMK
jgi:hypothetical protein